MRWNCNHGLLPMLLGAMMLAGCATKPGLLFPPLANPMSWPAAPDAPRIFYVGQVATSADLKPGVNGFEAMGRALFGKESALHADADGGLHGRRGPAFRGGLERAQLVHVFDLKSRKYATWKPGKGQPAFAQPVGIAWDSTYRRLLVSDSVAGAIFIFGTDGKYVGKIGDGIVQRPVGMAVDTSAATPGRIFVADAGAHQVVVLSAEGQLMQRVGGRGSVAGSFNFPTNVALGSNGVLYVSDSLNFRVQAFDRDLRPIGQFGKKGDMPGYFAEPKGIATDSEGHIYVLDGQFENVQLFDSQGRVLMDFGEEGNGPGQFWLPTALFIDAHDRIWIADSYNRRVQVFDYRRGAPQSEVMR